MTYKHTHENHYHNQDNDHTHHPQKFPHAPLQSTPSFNSSSHITALPSFTIHLFTFLRILYKMNHTGCTFCHAFLMQLNSFDTYPCSYCVLFIHLFWELSSVPLYGHTIVCLFTHLLTDIWALPDRGLLTNTPAVTIRVKVLVWTYAFIFLG